VFYLVQSEPHYHLIVNSCHDIAKLALNNNHSIIHYIDIYTNGRSIDLEVLINDHLHSMGSMISELRDYT
jgi:hypothetical protein